MCNTPQTTTHKRLTDLTFNHSRLKRKAVLVEQEERTLKGKDTSEETTCREITKQLPSWHPILTHYEKMETTPQETAEGMALVRVLAAVLDRLVCANTPIALADPGQVTKFHALKAPGIGVMQYLERIHKYASCSNECFVLALIYIDRLIQGNNFLLTELNVHRVVITAVLLAAKFFDDAYYNNAYYAKVGGVLVAEMNGLEVDFLFRINFSLHVTPDLFHKYREELLSHSNENTTLSPQLLDPFSAPIAAPASAPVSLQYQNFENLVYESEQQQIQTAVHQQGNQTRFSEKRQATYITPSPPPSQGGGAPPTLEHPYLQRSSTMPVALPATYPAGRRCSPQYACSTHSEPYFMVESTLVYPIHTDALVHHNHAKVEHGFHHQPHQEPTYDHATQYFGSHMLTGCTGGR